jgi:hypothetical protein
MLIVARKILSDGWRFSGSVLRNDFTQDGEPKSKFSPKDPQARTVAVLLFVNIIFTIKSKADATQNNRYSILTF